MIPPDIFKEPAFQRLSHAARDFYMMLNAHYAEDQQRNCLYETLKEYNDIFGLGMTEDDIKNEAYTTTKSRYYQGFFVIPQKHLKEYGYSPQYANKLKKELIAAGFIKAKYGNKGKETAWSRNVTVYQFVDDWKKHS